MNRDSDTQWLPVVGFEGLYEVSADGIFRSLYFDPPRILKHGRDSCGYPTIMLTKDGKRAPFTVHRLVALAFHPDKRNALHNEVAHLDGDKTNPRADNLKWVSKVENRSHRKRHGTESSGERHGNAKLTSDAVRHILATLESRARLAERYGVSPWTVDAVRRGRNWRHIKLEAING